MSIQVHVLVCNIYFLAYLIYTDLLNIFCNCRDGLVVVNGVMIKTFWVS